MRERERERISGKMGGERERVLKEGRKRTWDVFTVKVALDTLALYLPFQVSLL